MWFYYVTVPSNQFSASATFSEDDGTKITFTSDRDGNTEIYVMNAQDGSNQTRLTDNAASDALPEWLHSAR
jgi:Tol biopolymer transport system component